MIGQYCIGEMPISYLDSVQTITYIDVAGSSVGYCFGAAQTQTVWVLVGQEVGYCLSGAQTQTVVNITGYSLGTCTVNGVTLYDNYIKSGDRLTCENITYNITVKLY